MIKYRRSTKYYTSQYLLQSLLPDLSQIKEGL